MDDTSTTSTDTTICTDFGVVLVTDHAVIVTEIDGPSVVLTAAAALELGNAIDQHRSGLGAAAQANVQADAWRIASAIVTNLARGGVDVAEMSPEYQNPVTEEYGFVVVIRVRDVAVVRDYVPTWAEEASEVQEAKRYSTTLTHRVVAPGVVLSHSEYKSQSVAAS
jgi:hypothetical protein